MTWKNHRKNNPGIFIRTRSQEAELMCSGARLGHFLLDSLVSPPDFFTRDSFCVPHPPPRCPAICIVQDSEAWTPHGVRWQLHSNSVPSPESCSFLHE